MIAASSAEKPCSTAPISPGFIICCRKDCTSWTSSRSGLTASPGLPTVYDSSSFIAATSPSFAFSTSFFATSWRSASVTAAWIALRKAAVCLANGLPGPPKLPLVNFPPASRPPVLPAVAGSESVPGWFSAGEEGGAGSWGRTVFVSVADSVRSDSTVCRPASRRGSNGRLFSMASKLQEGKKRPPRTGCGRGALPPSILKYSCAMGQCQKCKLAVVFREIEKSDRRHCNCRRPVYTRSVIFFARDDRRCHPASATLVHDSPRCCQGP